MNEMEIIETVKPILKKMKVKDAEFAVINDLLVATNQERSLLYSFHIQPTNCLYANNSIHLENGEYICNRRILKELQQYFNYYSQFPIMHREENVLEYETFPNPMKIRADDAPTKYYIDKIRLPIFYGILPINKDDTLTINILNRADIDTMENAIAVRYDIFKKSLKGIISIYTRLAMV